VPAASLRWRPAKRSRPTATGRRQRRSRHPGQDTNRPQPTDEVDRAYDPKPRLHACPERAQCCHPLAQPAAALHHTQAKLAEHAAVNLLPVEPDEPAHAHNPPPLGPSDRTPLVENQLVRPVLTTASRNRRPHQAHPCLIRLCTLDLADHRLPAIRHMAHRVQRERPAVSPAAHLPQGVPRTGRAVAPASASYLALAIATRKTQQTPVRQPDRLYPAGFISTVLDDDESKAGRIRAGSGTLLQLASALRGLACWLCRGVASPPARRARRPPQHTLLPRSLQPNSPAR